MSERVLVWLLLTEDGAVLMGRRKADYPPFSETWVLPGDEMPEAESAAETVGRVGREQLDIRVATEEFADTLHLAADGVDYAVNIFRVVGYEGRPRFRESGPYSEVRWVVRDDLADESVYEMPPALRESLLKAA
jgi:ADP-ribose pyrophosphatase YjhB (NUDIX family)